VTVLLGAVIAIRENPPRGEPYRAMRAIVDRLDADLPAGGGTRLESAGTPETFGMDAEFLVGTLYWMRRTGHDAVVPPDVADRLSPDYGRGPFDRVLRITVDAPTEPGARLIERTETTDPILQDAAPKRVVSVTLKPQRGVADGD
jgi:hypothetical protein